MKNKITKLSLLLMITLLIVFGMSIIVKSEVKAADIGTVVGTKETPAPLDVSGWFKVYGATTTYWNMPKTTSSKTLPDFYCIYPGADLIYTGTRPQYLKVGNYKLPAAAAYIFSSGGNNNWTQSKQKAIWNLRSRSFTYNGETIKLNYNEDGRQLVYGSGTSHWVSSSTKGSSLDTPAMYYAQHDAKVRNVGLQPTSKTNVSNVQLTTDENGNTITGPFNIQYTSGIYGSGTSLRVFSGITKIQVIEYDENGAVLATIDVDKVILADMTTGEYGDAQTPDYFTPDATTKIDTTTQLYPDSQQNFKVVYKSSGKNIATIGLKVTFQYMLADGEYIEYKGTKAGATQQKIMSEDAVRAIYQQEIEIKKDLDIYDGANLGGNVWEDIEAGKESKQDGRNDTVYDGKEDKTLKNIKVTLYTEDGNLATLLSDPNEEGISEEEILHRINPTYTDANGNYLFKGLDENKKYYVTFEYNGQIYLPTDKLSNAYDESIVTVTSKGLEKEEDRSNFDQKFAEIASYPKNYVTSNSLSLTTSILVNEDGKWYNAAFSQKDLMGYTLDNNGQYVKTQIQLVDGYLYDSNGLETENYSDGEISKEVRAYIVANKKFPDDNAMIEIYKKIAGSDKELWQKLQFIEDCKIKSYTESREVSLYVNQGLWRRKEFDLATIKDIYSAVVKINGQSAVYKYDKKGEDDEYWDINVRMSDYEAFYGSGYTREVDKTAYDNTSSGLEIYVTYKITVRNQSGSIMGEVKEVVDYYDKEYTYRNDLSWVTYKDSDKNATITDAEYKEAMVAEDLSKIANARDINSSSSSKYGDSTRSDIADTYGTIYVRGLEDKKLSTGESEYIYLTFQVNKDSNNRVILDDDSSPKQNFTEINGFITYYKDNTTLPNSVTKSSSDIAGLLDRDSNPGNLTSKDIEDEERYEKNFEDDTDRAKGLRVIIIENAVRVISGTVWEDRRTVTVDGAKIGNGIMDDGEIKIAGITVQLIDSSGNVCKTTTTSSDGQYKLVDFEPGNYKIRFIYGDSVSTVKVKGSTAYSEGGLNEVSYNGQDFKSTVYKDGAANTSDAVDLWERRQTVNQYSSEGVTNHTAEVLASPYETPTYNGVAYTAEEMEALINELIEKTYMTAETGTITVGIEENAEIEGVDFGLVERPKAQLEIDKTVSAVKVTLANGSVLFDVNKSSDNVIWQAHEEYNLANYKEDSQYKDYYGESGKNRYSYRNEINQFLQEDSINGIIQLTIDEELMHGATIQISYKVKIVNDSEVDYEGQDFYYKGITSGANPVTTKADQIVDYVANNLQFNSNNTANSGWTIISADDLKSGLVNDKLSDNIAKFNNIIQTDKLNTALKPGESTAEQTLVLTQLITTENKSDDLTYKNMVEIVKTSNTVGRRMAFSVVGNQDPTASQPSEIDSRLAERVIILPPFGEVHIFYILGVTIGIILVAGIAFIIRKVLKR